MHRPAISWGAGLAAVAPRVVAALAVIAAAAPASAALDATAPTTPRVLVSAVTDDSISAAWSATDAETGIVEYQAAASTTKTEKGRISDWQSFGIETSGELKNLPLLDLKTYYVIVKARNGDGLWSKFGASAPAKCRKAPALVVVKPAGASVKVNVRQRFTAAVLDRDGAVLRGRKIVWSCACGEPESGSINGSGLFTAGCKLGDCTVTAKVAESSVSGSALVQVIAGDPFKVRVHPASATVTIGQKQQFKALVSDRCGNSLTGVPVTWSVTDKKAGTIDAAGLFTAGTLAKAFPRAIKAKAAGKAGLATVKVAKAGWSVLQDASELRIGYGSGGDFPQYAALHLESGYFRMNYGSGSTWGTSVVLLPSFFEKGRPYKTQGAPVSAFWFGDGADLVIALSAVIGQSSQLTVSGTVRLSPPEPGSIRAAVSMSASGTVELADRPGEAFQPVMLSSMHLDADRWDARSAYVGGAVVPIPDSDDNKWILQPTATGTVFGLNGGLCDGLTHPGGPEMHPTIEVSLEDPQELFIGGWLAKSSDENDDNVGFWAGSDELLTSWTYSIVAKAPP